MSKQIKYSSTRGGETSLSYEDVLLSGLARDGGLFMPEEWPHFSFSELEDMKSLDYAELATKIIIIAVIVDTANPANKHSIMDEFLDSPIDSATMFDKPMTMPNPMVLSKLNRNKAKPPAARLISSNIPIMIISVVDIATWASCVRIKGEANLNNGVTSLE